MALLQSGKRQGHLGPGGEFRGDAEMGANRGGALELAYRGDLENFNEEKIGGKWSGLSESNRHLNLGKVPYYHYTKAA